MSFRNVFLMLLAILFLIMMQVLHSKERYVTLFNLDMEIVSIIFRARMAVIL